MNLTKMFKQMEENDFKPTKTNSKWLRNGRYGVKITQIELDRTDPKPESGKEPQDYVKYHLEVVEPKEYAGKVDYLKFYPNSKGDKRFGPDKDMTYGLWSFVDTTVILWQAGFFKLPTSVLSDEQELIKVLTTKSNETIKDKVFYIEKIPQDNPKFSNVNFLELNKEKAGELGEFPEETQVEAEKLADATTLKDSDNPFAREVENGASGDDAKDDDDWL